MDKSHVALVSLKLEKEGFQNYRADRNISLGLNLPNVAKILKARPRRVALVGADSCCRHGPAVASCAPPPRARLCPSLSSAPPTTTR